MTRDGDEGSRMTRDGDEGAGVAGTEERRT